MMNATQQEVKIEPSQYENGLFSNQIPFGIYRPSSRPYQEFRQNAQWLDSEKSKYAAFIQYHHNAMQGKQLKVLWSMFQRMAKYIKSRNFRQCKLFHQKMVQNYKTIPSIISFFLKNIPKFQNLLQRERQHFSKDQKLVLKNNMKQAQNKQNPGMGNKLCQEKTQKGTDYYYKTAQKYQQILKQNDLDIDQQWRQCHRLFILWTNLMEKLTTPRVYP